MVRKIIVAVVAIAIFAGVGLYFYGSLETASRRIAIANQDSCYTTRGYPAHYSPDTPQAVVEECNGPMLQANQEAPRRMMIATGVGALPALVFLGLAFLFFRRRKPEQPAGA